LAQLKDKLEHFKSASDDEAMTDTFVHIQRIKGVFLHLFFLLSLLLLYLFIFYNVTEDYRKAKAQRTVYAKLAIGCWKYLEL